MSKRFWFFAFTPKTERPWLKRFPFRFRHCFALTVLGPCTFMIDPLYRQVEYGLTNEIPINQALGELRAKGYVILHLEYEADPKAFPRRSPFMTCASLIAYACGIPSLAFTPDGLYRDIIKLGGELLP